MDITLLMQQVEVCERFGVDLFPAPGTMKVGISLSAKEGQYPVHGVHLFPVGDTTGWYIYAGEWSDDRDFYKPLHLHHLTEWCPIVLPYMQLPPGWRFLLAPGYEDVWFDPEVLREQE